MLVISHFGQVLQLESDEIIIPEEGFKMEDIVASIKAGYECGKNTTSSFWPRGYVSR